MSNTIHLLPRPQEVAWHEGRYVPAGTLAVDGRVADKLRVALDELLQDARAKGVDLKVASATPEGTDAPVTIRSGTALRRSSDLAEAGEAYTLQISPSGLRMTAHNAHGLYNALQTLRQLINQAAGALPCVSIRDWPAMSLRGIHLDFKGGMAPASYWQETISLLGHYKINAVLVEYEDKFPFDNHREVVGPGALTRPELDALLETARDHFVQIVPLLQTIGHVEYILRRPQYQALRESGNLSQLCPQQEGSIDLIKELLDEVMSAHPDTSLFHLGADEAWLLGNCPRCREVVQRQGKLGLFLGYLNQAIEHVTSRGFRPIIWDDMIQRNLQGDSLDLLPENVILCNWSYGPTEERLPIFFYGGSEGHMRFRWASKQWLERDPGVLPPHVQWLEDAPRDVVSFARRYWDRGEYPLYGSSLPWVRFFHDHGRAVIGASAAKGASGFDAFSPDFESRLGNVMTWAQTAQAEGAEGVIGTAWSRYSTLNVPCEPFEMGWYTYLASAAFDWEAATPDRQAYDEQFLSAFVRSGDSGVTRGIRWLDRGKGEGKLHLLRQAAETFEGASSATTAGRRQLAHLALAARLAEVQVAARKALDGGWSKYGRAQTRRLGADAFNGALIQANEVREMLRDWRERAASVLATSLLPDDVEEAIATQTGGMARRLVLLSDEYASMQPFEGDEE